MAGDLQAAEKASANIRDAINKITARQMNDGGMAPWPGSLQADEWITSYTGHFMAEAEGKGFSIPSGYRQKWNSFRGKEHRTGVLTEPSTMAVNCIQATTHSQVQRRKAMNRLRNQRNLRYQMILGRAYALTGRTEVAGDLLI